MKRTAPAVVINAAGPLSLSTSISSGTTPPASPRFLRRQVGHMNVFSRLAASTGAASSEDTGDSDSQRSVHAFFYLIFRFLLEANLISDSRIILPLFSAKAYCTNMTPRRRARSRIIRWNACTLPKVTRKPSYPWPPKTLCSLRDRKVSYQWRDLWASTI